MVSRLQLYRCELCGNIVELLEAGGGRLVCCGQPMNLQVENTVDAAVEKHVPMLNKVDGGWEVLVGEVAHPMVLEHYIGWIDLVAGPDVYRHFLEAGQEPKAFFPVDAAEVTARAWCNLHGYWKS